VVVSHTPPPPGYYTGLCPTGSRGCHTTTRHNVMPAAISGHTWLNLASAKYGHTPAALLHTPAKSYTHNTSATDTGATGARHTSVLIPSSTSTRHEDGYDLKAAAAATKRLSRGRHPFLQPHRRLPGPPPSPDWCCSTEKPKAHRTVCHRQVYT
jgi:hypothetical protein